MRSRPRQFACLDARLVEKFLRSLLGWVHSGFSVRGEQTVPAKDVQGAERLAQYLTRGPRKVQKHTRPMIRRSRVTRSGFRSAGVTCDGRPRRGVTWLARITADRMRGAGFWAKEYSPIPT